MTKFLSALIALVLVFSACSSNSEPIEEEPEIDYDYYKNVQKRENEYELPSSYEDELCFTFEVPDLTGMDKS